MQQQICIKILDWQKDGFNKQQFVKELLGVLKQDRAIMINDIMIINVPNEQQESTIYTIQALPGVVLSQDALRHDIPDNVTLPILALPEELPMIYECYENNKKNKTYKSNLAKTDNLLKKFQKTNNKKYSTVLYNRTRHK